MKHKFHPGLRVLAASAITVVALLAFAGAVLAATVLVDHFDSGVQDLFGTINTANVPVVLSGTVTAPPGFILGNERDIVITGTSPSASDLFNIRVITGAGGRLSIATDPSVFVKAQVDWDGVDGNPLNLNTVGLGGVDLTGGGTNSAFHLAVSFDDLPVLVSLKVYSGANWSFYNLNLPGGIVSGNRVDFTIPFSAFVVGGGTGMSTSSAGAIVMDIDTSASPGADLVMEFLQVDSAQDFGDLPNGYGTLLPGGPRHTTLTGLRLGSNVDAETDGQPSTDAKLDDTNQSPPNDEEGVKASLPAWSVAAGGSITVTVNGCTGTCNLNGWIDWNGDGSFAQVGDQVFNGVVVGNGTSVRSITVPTNAFWNTTVYARFRLCGGTGGAGNDCNSPTGASAAGEVEDYAWGFGPTAVTLESLQAQPTTSPAMPVALIGVSAATLIGVVLFVRRRKTA
jgi:hypothetical protein